MDQVYGICKVSVAPLRSEPSDKAENASQLLFGEYVEVLEKSERWWHVQAKYDGYEGWMDFKQLAIISAEQFENGQLSKYLVPPSPLNILTDENGGNYYLSPGSNLPGLKDSSCYIDQQQFDLQFQPAEFVFNGIEKLIKDALFFQNTPYLWGGRSFFGIDCSGFVQTVYKLNGIKLRRDAWQQAEEGTTVDFLQEVQPGDVAFFDNDEGRITHVGIMLNTSEIIHASGKVKIDPIDGQGIYSAELARYTHKLRIIKRFV
ncbi:MAG: C40 family peptidase [Bacteroidota bacterium]